jgi:hypothetical protein
LFQRSSAKERITREGDHRQRRQAKNSCAIHAEVRRRNYRAKSSRKTK